MTTAECIRQRVSCRRFQETPIPREDIRRVVDLARFSPSLCDISSLMTRR